MQSLHSKIFKKEFVNTFKGDHSGNLGARQTPGVLYSKAIPTPVKHPILQAWSENLAKELEINNPDDLDVAILGGNHVSATMYPYAACYAGHQFGNWAGQLGDGRAITLGELETSIGNSWELQLKGAGPTPYSRRADGRAVLRSSVREYLMSEAMFYLGVPTTRALGLVTTGDQVLRDMFYNGNAAYEPGAIVMRASPSFLRFGNFEILAARQEIDNLKQLTEWTISKFYPHIQGDNKIIHWYKEVVDRTAALMVEWLRVGFVHGVMNTDNMSILGLTIDYGPYSFLDDYDLSFTPNTTDLPGRRYAFGNQSSIAYWNLSCLASAIAPLFEDTKELVSALETFEDIFYKKYFSMMGNKLGFDVLKPEDTDLLARIEEMLSAIQPDMTIFYQLLIDLPLNLEKEQDIVSHFQDAFYKELSTDESKLFITVIRAYQERIKNNQCSREDSANRMHKANPRFILRNYLLHQAIEELEKGQNDLFIKLQMAMKDPYSKTFDEFFTKRPNWATQKAGCSMLSCSS
jgi:uncharacterized protein YdiU (UPF0061 family)